APRAISDAIDKFTEVTSGSLRQAEAGLRTAKGDLEEAGKVAANIGTEALGSVSEAAQRLVAAPLKDMEAAVLQHARELTTGVQVAAERVAGAVNAKVDATLRENLPVIPIQ